MKKEKGEYLLSWKEAAEILTSDEDMPKFIMDYFKIPEEIANEEIEINSLGKAEIEDIQKWMNECMKIINVAKRMGAEALEFRAKVNDCVDWRQNDSK